MVGMNIREHPHYANYEFLTPSRGMLDLLDKHSTEKFIQSNQPDMIIHAAGLVGGIQANSAQPIRFLVENMEMGINVITAAANCKVKYLLNLASSCMYPKDYSGALQEDMILAGKMEPSNEGYALAKIACTRLCEYVSESDSELDYKTLIPCNLYGRHDKFDPENSHMIPAVIQKLDRAVRDGRGDESIWGTGEARREFMYAADLADFLFFVIEKVSELPQNLNIGLGYDLTIREYYQAIAEVVGYTGSFTQALNRPVGMERKLLDVSKMRSVGWDSTTSLFDGLEQTYKFFQANHR